MRRPAALVAFLSVLLVSTPGHSSETPATPLRNEDIVRMIVAGQPVSGILETLRSREADFDVSDEMVQELRAAGVPDAVIALMRERQAETERKRAAAGPAPALPGAKIRIFLEPAGNEAGSARPVSLVYPDHLDDKTARALQIGDPPEERAVTDIAVFLACRTPDHIPDQWRSKSPVGRDFVSMPRHQMLRFQAGAVRGDRRKHVLELGLPAELEAEVEPNVAHDLVVGVAIRAGDRFLVVASDRRDGVVAGPEGLALGVALGSIREADAWKIIVRFAGNPAR